LRRSIIYLFCMFTPSFSAVARGVGGACVVLAAAALGLAGCRDKTPAPDPCQGQLANPLTLRFIEAFGTPTPDTAYNNQPMVFEAPGALYTSYKWLVGQVDERTGRRVGVSFDNKTLGTIPVRLIATRPPNKACFKNDDGVDTLTKTLTLVPYRDQRAPIYGRFRGANKDTPNDTFSVRIYQGPNVAYPNNPAAEPSNYAVGVPKGCRKPYRDIGLTWRGITASDGGCSGGDITKGYLTSRDSIRIEYRAQLSPTIIDKVFLGKRVR
jgi:hypothetical protein